MIVLQSRGLNFILVEILMKQDLRDEHIWVKRVDITQKSVTFFQLWSLNTPILKQAQTKVKIFSALFCQ